MKAMFRLFLLGFTTFGVSATGITASTPDCETKWTGLRSQLSQAKTQINSGLLDGLFKDMALEYLQGVQETLDFPPPGDCDPLERELKTEIKDTLALLDFLESYLASQDPPIRLTGNQTDARPLPILSESYGKGDEAKFPLIQIFKKTGEKPLTGTNDREKLSDYIADQFDNLVRTYVAGSEQLKIDKKLTASEKDGLIKSSTLAGCTGEIKGMLQGHFPVLLGGVCPTGTGPSPAEEQFGGAACQPGGGAQHGRGVVNPLNDWFKKEGAIGPVRESIRRKALYTHQKACDGVRIRNSIDRAYVVGRGYLIHIYMTIARKMFDSIRLNQSVPSKSVFGISLNVDRAEFTANQAMVMQSEAWDHFKSVNDGLQKTQGSPINYEQCGLKSFAATQTDSRPIEFKRETQTLKGTQIRPCIVASMQLRAEVEMPIRYAYFVWLELVSELYPLIRSGIMECFLTGPCG